MKSVRWHCEPRGGQLTAIPQLQARRLQHSIQTNRLFPGGLQGLQYPPTSGLCLEGGNQRHPDPCPPPTPTRNPRHRLAAPADFRGCEQRNRWCAEHLQPVGKAALGLPDTRNK